MIESHTEVSYQLGILTKATITANLSTGWTCFGAFAVNKSTEVMAFGAGTIMGLNTVMSSNNVIVIMLEN